MIPNKKTSNTRSTIRGFLVISAILVFSRIYFIINENKKYRRAILLSHEVAVVKGVDSIDVEEMPFLFAVFILLLTGMPILR
jgi:hypothetical protein